MLISRKNILRKWFSNLSRSTRITYKFVRTQSYGPYPRFLIWLVCDQGLRMYISQSCQVISMLQQWTTQSEKHSLKNILKPRASDILFEKPGGWKHREDVLVQPQASLAFSEQNWNPFHSSSFPYWPEELPPVETCMLIHLSSHSYCSFHIGIPFPSHVCLWKYLLFRV